MITYLVLALMILLPFIWLRVVKKKKWKQIRNDLFPKYQGNKKELVGSFALLGALLVAFIFISSSITIIEEGSGLQINDLDKVNGIVDEDFSAGPLLFIGIIIVTLFFEEFFFRAFLVPRVGIILSTILFSLAHYGYGSIMQFIGTFALGLILAYWFKKKRSLFQNYFGHLLYDIVAIILYLII